MTDAKLVRIVADACINEPYANPSVRDLAERHGVDAADIRREFDKENWHRIRGIVLEVLAENFVKAIIAPEKGNDASDKDA